MSRIPMGVLTEDDVQQGVYITSHRNLPIGRYGPYNMRDCNYLSVIDIDTNETIKRITTPWKQGTRVIAKINGWDDPCILMGNGKEKGVFGLRSGELLNRAPSNSNVTISRSPFVIISENDNSRPSWYMKNCNDNHQIQLWSLNPRSTRGTIIRNLDSSENTCIHYSDYFGKMVIGGREFRRQKLSVYYLDRCEGPQVEIDAIYSTAFKLRFCPVLEETKQMICTDGSYICMYDIHSHTKICRWDLCSSHWDPYGNSNRCTNLHRDGHMVISTEMGNVVIYDVRKFGNSVTRMDDPGLYVNRCNTLEKICEHKFAYSMSTNFPTGLKYNMGVINTRTCKMEKGMLVGNQWTSVEGICSYPSDLKRTLQEVDEEERIQYILMLRRETWLLSCGGEEEPRALVTILLKHMHKAIQARYDAANVSGKVQLLSQYIVPMDDIWFVYKVCCLVSSLEVMGLTTYKHRLHLVLDRARDNSIARRCLVDVGSIRGVVTDAIDRLTAANKASEAEKYRQFLGTLDDAMEPLIGITVGAGADDEVEVDDEATAPPISEMSTTWASHTRVQETVARWKMANSDIYIDQSVNKLMGMIEADEAGLRAFGELQNLRFTPNEPFLATVTKWMYSNGDLLARTPALAALVQNVCPFYSDYPATARIMYSDASRRNSWFGFDFEDANDWTDYWRDATFAAVNGGKIKEIQVHGLGERNSIPMRVVWYDNMRATREQIFEWKDKGIGLVLIGESVEWPSTTDFERIRFMHASGIGDSVPRVPNVEALELEFLKISRRISLESARFIRLKAVDIDDDVSLNAPVAELVSINGVTGGGYIRLPKDVVLEIAMVAGWSAWVPDGALHVTADSLDGGLPSADFGTLQLVHGPVKLQTAPDKMKIGRLELVQCWDMNAITGSPDEEKRQDGKLIEKCVMRQCRLLSPQNLDFLYYCTSLTFDNTAVVMDSAIAVLGVYPHLARIKVLGIVPLCIVKIIYKAPELVTLRLERAYTYVPIVVESHKLIKVSVHELYGNVQIDVRALSYELDSISLRLMGEIAPLKFNPELIPQIRGVGEEDEDELNRVFGEDRWTIDTGS